MDQPTINYSPELVVEALLAHKEEPCARCDRTLGEHILGAPVDHDFIGKEDLACLN
jgi:hypothetical protein